METDILKDIRTKLWIENKVRYFEEIAKRLEPHGFTKVKINVSNSPDRFEYCTDSKSIDVGNKVYTKTYETNTDYLRVKFKSIYLDVTFTTNGWQIQAGVPQSTYGGSLRSIDSFVKRVKRDYFDLKIAYDKWYEERGKRIASELGIL